MFYINYLLSPHPLLLHLNMSMPSNTDSQDVVQKWGWMWEIPPQAHNMFETHLPPGAHFLAEVHRRLTRAQSHISTEGIADNSDEPGALKHPYIKCGLWTCFIIDELSDVGYNWRQNPFGLYIKRD